MYKLADDRVAGLSQAMNPQQPSARRLLDLNASSIRQIQHKFRGSFARAGGAEHRGDTL